MAETTDLLPVRQGGQKLKKNLYKLLKCNYYNCMASTLLIVTIGTNGHHWAQLPQRTHLFFYFVQKVNFIPKLARWKNYLNKLNSYLNFNIKCLKFSNMYKNILMQYLKYILTYYYLIINYLAKTYVKACHNNRRLWIYR